MLHTQHFCIKTIPNLYQQIFCLAVPICSFHTPTGEGEDNGL